MFQIMVVEDDQSTARWIQAVLIYEGYHVVLAENGAVALDIIDKQHIDLIILDIMMPKMDGYEFTKTLRSVDEHTPILMVTAKETPEDKYKGFLAGTDDYMVKPVNEKEMLFRIRALLRRSHIANEHKLTIGNVTLDYDSLSVTRGEVRLTLPQKEFYLLYKLLSYPGQIFTRLQLMDEIWGKDSTSADNTVTVHIVCLRKRFAGWPEFELVSIRGIGYKAVIHNE